MARYLLLAMNGPTGGEGDEEAYHRWYDHIHLPDFREMAEVVSARRFKTLRGSVPGMDEPWPYVVAYEIETNDFAGFSKKLAEKMQSFSPALDRSWSANLMTMQIGDDE
jgi:hypothetical protein